MASHAEEQELEDLKKWWGENGRSIVAGVVIGLVAIGGWRGWGAWQDNQAAAASDVYQQAVQALESADMDALSAAEQTLINDYANSPYTALASLALGKVQIEAGQLEAAAAALGRAVAQAESDEVRQVARLRLARVQGELGQLDAALQTLNADFPAAYRGLAAEARGDIHVLAGTPDQARAAYQRALESGAPVADAAALDIKLNELAQPVDAGAAN